MNQLCKTALVVALIIVTTLQPSLQAASNLPTGGTFSAGRGTISAAGNVLTINQNSLKGIIDWNTFSIGTNSTVNFKNGSGATLNRVTGTTPTTIFGQLTASGNVYLLNPEGILIGHGATIHTGGDFLASTLNLRDSTFLSATTLTFTGSSSATVINLGDLTSNGGSIYLIGHTVQNAGSIATPNGTTGLAAGSLVLITDSSNNQRVAVQAPGGDITNSGFIAAAQVELKSNGGNIYALAGNNGGQIQATGTATQNGHVWLVSENGTTSVSGLISAIDSNGSGGAIETSGAQVLTDAATIKTGKNGSWLLDPADLNIDQAMASTIENSLNGGTNVTEQTTASGTGNTPGDINVQRPIAWNGAATLTLSAYDSITVNQYVTISNIGSGNLTLRADNASTGAGAVNIFGLIDFSASTGNVAILYNPPGSASAKYGNAATYSIGTNGTQIKTNPGWTPPANQSLSSQATAYMLVNNVTDLQNIDVSDTGTYALGQNIDASSTSVTPFTPLGNSTAFTGILDGQGFTITGLNMTQPTGNVGLFGQIGSGGIVRNLNFASGSINQSGNGGTDVGILAGQNHGTIANVSASGTVTPESSDQDVGGLVGFNDDVLLNALSNVSINGGSQHPTDVGGLVGQNGLNGTITSSSSTGSVSISSGNTNAQVGGLVGANFNQISDSFASGSVSGGNDQIIGGLVGYSSSAVANSYATGSVSGGTSSTGGGLIGFASGGSVTSSYATGSVSGGTASTVGGLIGIALFSSVTGSYATGSVSAGASSYAGGLFGDSLYSTDSNSYWDTQSTGQSAASGGGTVSGASGETTSQLQSGILPSGFSSSNWSASSGVYPFLNWQGKAVSGDVFNGTSPIPSVQVTALANGVSIGSGTTNSTGFYEFFVPPTTVSGVLTYLPGSTTGNTFSDGDGLGQYSGMNIYAGTLQLLSRTNGSYSAMTAALNAALGGNSGANFLFSANGNNITLTAGTNLAIKSQLPFTLDQTISTTGTLAITSVGDVSQSAPFTVGALSLAGACNYTLGQANNIGTLAASTGGDVSVTNSSDITIGSVGSVAGVTAAGTVNIASNTGNLTLASGTIVTANGSGDALQLSVGNAFLNLSGSNALNVASGGGRWLVFSQNPANDTRGGLAYDFKQYNYNSSVNSPDQATGNGFLYTYAPTINIGLTGTTTKTYDGTTAATLTSANYSLSGAVDGDAITLSGTPTAGSFADQNVGSSKTVSANGLSLSDLGISNGSATIYGYQLAGTTAVGNIGTINPATLTYTSVPTSQTSGSSNNTFAGTVAGFVNGETLASATTGTAAFHSSTTASSTAGTYAINGSGLTADHGNYDFVQAQGNATALTLTASVIPTPTPTPTPIPTPTPTAPVTTLSFVINNTTVLEGQTPTFSSTYTGAPIAGLNISALLSGLNYSVTPALDGPGTYRVTATGIAPSGYVFQIAPVTFNVLDSSPVTIPSVTGILTPELPQFFTEPESASSSSFLIPANSLGLFQIDISGTSSGRVTQQVPLSQSLFFASPDGKSDKFAAGANPNLLNTFKRELQ